MSGSQVKLVQFAVQHFSSVQSLTCPRAHKSLGQNIVEAVGAHGIDDEIGVAVIAPAARRRPCKRSDSAARRDGGKHADGLKPLQVNVEGYAQDMTSSSIDKRTFGRRNHRRLTRTSVYS